MTSVMGGETSSSGEALVTHLAPSTTISQSSPACMVIIRANHVAAMVHPCSTNLICESPRRQPSSRMHTLLTPRNSTHALRNVIDHVALSHMHTTLPPPPPTISRTLPAWSSCGPCRLHGPRGPRGPWCGCRCGPSCGSSLTSWSWCSS